MTLPNAKLLGAAGGSFSPDKVEGLLAWYDADDLATITTSNGAVTSWADKAGSYDLIPVNGNATSMVRSINGRNALYFNGSAGLVTTAPYPMRVTNSFSQFIVFEVDNLTNDHVLLEHGANTNNASYGAGLIYVHGSGPDTVKFYTKNPSATVAESLRTPEPQVPHIVVGTCNTDVHEGLRQKLRLDGEYGDYDIYNTYNGLSIADYVCYFGARSGSSLFLKGTLAEILIYNRDLPLSEIREIEHYLANKWGVQISEKTSIDPELDISWHSLFWAEGTAFSAQNLSAGDPVFLWPNETGEVNASTVNPGIYSISNDYRVLNNKPTVNFFNQTAYYKTDPFDVPLDYTNGVSVVVIGKHTFAMPSYWFDGLSALDRNIFWISNTLLNKWAIYAGDQEVGTLLNPDTKSHLFLAHFDTTSELDIDNEHKAVGNVGTMQLSGLTIGSRFNNINMLSGHIAFLGVYEGDIRNDPSWSEFLAWANYHYGVIIQ